MKRQRLVIVSGVGYRQTVIPGSGREDVFTSPHIKPNIGAWISKTLYLSGLDVLMLARTKEKLTAIKDSIQRETGNRSQLYYEAIDLLDAEATCHLRDKYRNGWDTIDLVHSVGLSSGGYNVKDDNPYLSIKDTPIDLPIMEFEVIVKSLLCLVQSFLPVFNDQKETRIIVVSSMSGIRAFPYGYSHASAKAGLHHAVRSLTLELNKSNIFVSEILPGIVNTGMYDNPVVLEAVREIGKSFGYDYKDVPLPQIPPKEVAKAVELCLLSEAHILAVEMVSKGQWPHSGA